MAEPTTLEEAYEGYKANKFSRKDLWGFMIDRLKATEARVTAVEEQNRQLVTALVRGVQGAQVNGTVIAQPGTPEWDDTEVRTGNNDLREDMALIAQARDLGIKIDKRWSMATIKAKVDAANGAMEAVRG